MMWPSIESNMAVVRAMAILHISLTFFGSIFAVMAPIITLMLMMKSDVQLSIII